jgi:hypothetical protein
MSASTVMNGHAVPVSGSRVLRQTQASIERRDARGPRYRSRTFSIKLGVLLSNVRLLQRGLKVLRPISRNSGIKAGEIGTQIDHACC